MSKILEATCLGGIVKYLGTPVDAEVFSGGVAQSKGILLLEDGKAYYLASSSADIGQTLDKLIDALTKITETLTAIGGNMTGPTTSPPAALAPNVIAINLIVAELETLKGNLI